jgi:tetratricopeptide (TPR) repeat protein
MSLPARTTVNGARLYRHACAWLLALGLGLTSGMPSARSGQDGLSPQTYQRLNTIHGLIDEGKSGAALTALDELLQAVGQRRYERAVVLQNLAHVQAGRGDYPAAIKAFGESLSLDALPDTAAQQMRYNLAQLHLVTDEPARAITVLEQWFEHADSPPAEAWLLLGHAHARLKDYRAAVPALQQAIRLAGNPHADWYESLLAMHYELQSYTECAVLLEQMIRLFPGNDAYWRQLSGIYLTMDRPSRALAVQELAWQTGRMTSEADLLQLAQLYLYQEIPFKAARLLEDAMQTGEISGNTGNRTLLATAWALARERDQAIRSYRLAAQNSTDADVDFTLAQLYLEDERWSEAAQALDAALEKPGLKAPGTAWLLLGIARYELDATGSALEAFTKASGYENSRKSAHQWLEHLEQKP